MKNTYSRRLSLFLAFLTVFLSFPFQFAAVETLALETLPTAFSAPSNVTVYESGSYIKTVYVKQSAGADLLKFISTIEGTWSDKTGTVNDGDYFWTGYGMGLNLYSAALQVDYRVNGGEWISDTSWDNAALPDKMGKNGAYSFSLGDTLTNGTICNWVKAFDFYEYNVNDSERVESALKPYLVSSTDGDETYYCFDKQNHLLEIRCRYAAQVSIGGMYDNYETESSEKMILSPWSSIVSYGKGASASYTVPASIPAPVISNPSADENGGNEGAPAVEFTLNNPDEINKLICWPEQYDGIVKFDSCNIEVQAGIDNQWLHTYTLKSANMFIQSIDIYDLWLERAELQGGSYKWDDKSVRLRARYTFSATQQSGNDIELTSEWSNVLSQALSAKDAYMVNITHGEFGYNGGGTQSITRSAGQELGWIAGDPATGCYIKTVTVNGTTMYDKADTATYDLLTWWEDNYDEFKLPEADNAVNRDLDIVITYGGTPSKQYAIRVIQSANGVISPDGDTNNDVMVYDGNNATFTVSPNGGFAIDTVKADGVDVTDKLDGNEYTFTGVTAGHTIAATYKRVAWNVSINSNSTGSIEADIEDFDEYVPVGGKVTLTFVPKTDEKTGLKFALTSVIIDGNENEQARADGKITFENISANHTVFVTFASTPTVEYAVTATSGANGKISPANRSTHAEGTNATFTITPDTGYELDTLTVDGGAITNLHGNSYVFTNIKADHTIHATFKKSAVAPVTYKITVKKTGADVNTVSPSGVITVNEGTNFSVTYSAQEGYFVSKVLVDGVPAADINNGYTLIDIRAPHTIEVVFELLSYEVKFVDRDGKTIKTETVEHGKTATAPTAPQVEHYDFVRWDTQFNSVAANVTIKAIYVPSVYSVKYISWNNEVLKTEKVVYGKDAVPPTAPEREGYVFTGWSDDYTSVNSDIVLVAKYKALTEYDKLILIDGIKLEINSAAELLYMSENTTASTLLKQFKNKEEDMQVFDFNDSEISDKSKNVGTGWMVKLFDDNGKEIDRVVVILRGDTNGDGTVTSTDYLQIKSAFLRKYTLAGVNYAAADTDDDGSLSSTDYLQIKSHFLKTFNLYA